MSHRTRSSLARLNERLTAVRLNERLTAVRLNKRLTAGVGAALLMTGAATGTAVALTSTDSAPHSTAAAAAQPATRPTTDVANRSLQRAPLAADAAKAAAAAKAKADAAAKAKAQAAAAAKVKAAAAAKAKADAAAKAKAQAAAAKAKAQAAARPSYANNLSGWIAQAQAVLAAHGDHVPSAGAITARAMTESSGNPNAVNNWDSNAAAGIPSKGLMQVIAPTFATYGLPGHNDIMNPVDNIIAAVRYANATYGAFENIAYTKSGY
jgi:hypothetical protein